MPLLREDEYIGYEVYFPNGDAPQYTLDLLESYGFCKSQDGFYIPREALFIFESLAAPYKVGIMQYNIILEGNTPENQRRVMNQLLDMINELKAAGIGGIDDFISKIKQLKSLGRR